MLNENHALIKLVYSLLNQTNENIIIFNIFNSFKLSLVLMAIIILSYFEIIIIHPTILTIDYLLSVAEFLVFIYSPAIIIILILSMSKVTVNYSKQVLLIRNLIFTQRIKFKDIIHVYHFPFREADYSPMNGDGFNVKIKIIDSKNNLKNRVISVYSLEFRHNKYLTNKLRSVLWHIVDNNSENL